MTRMRGRFAHVLVLGAVVLAVVALAGCDWTQIGFGPDRPDANPVEPALTPSSVAHFTESWTKPCLCGPVLVANGLVYTSEFVPGDSNPPRDQVLRVRDASSGAERWSTTFKSVDIAQFIGVANGLAYARLSFSGPSEQDPKPASDVLLAFDATTGAARWLRVPPAAGTGAADIVDALVDGSRLFVVTRVAAGFTVSAIDTTGGVIWQANVGGFRAFAADPGHTLHVVSFVALHSDGTGVSVLSSFAEPTGSRTDRLIDAGPTPLSEVAFANGLLYGTGGGNVNLFALHPATGTRAWNQAGESFVAVAPGALVSRTASGLAGRNPITGASLWTTGLPPVATVGVQNPVIGGGVVFLAAQSTVRAFSLATGAPAGTVSIVGNDFELTPAAGRLFVMNSFELHVLTPAG